MKMAKPTERDLDAAGRLLSLMDCLTECRARPSEPAEGEGVLALFQEGRFDPQDGAHALALCHELQQILQASVGWPTRVIGGMAYVICWEENRIIDPAARVLELHPDLREGLKLLEAQRATGVDAAPGRTPSADTIPPCPSSPS